VDFLPWYSTKRETNPVVPVNSDSNEDGAKSAAKKNCGGWDPWQHNE